jgi:hypothetical protein
MSALPPKADIKLRGTRSRMNVLTSLVASPHSATLQPIAASSAGFVRAGFVEGVVLTRRWLTDRYCQRSRIDQRLQPIVGKRGWHNYPLTSLMLVLNGIRLLNAVRSVIPNSFSNAGVVMSRAHFKGVVIRIS